MNSFFEKISLLQIFVFSSAILSILTEVYIISKNVREKMNCKVKLNNRKVAEHQVYNENVNSDVGYGRIILVSIIDGHVDDIKITNASSQFEDTSITDGKKIYITNEIFQVSQHIDDIIRSMDNVAEQANSLSLSASIEAERADGLGEGFKVVADEIERLSIENSKAAKEIQACIDLINNLDKVNVKYDSQRGVNHQGRNVHRKENSMESKYLTTLHHGRVIKRRRNHVTKRMVSAIQKYICLIDDSP